MYLWRVIIIYTLTLSVAFCDDDHQAPLEKREGDEVDDLVANHTNDDLMRLAHRLFSDATFQNINEHLNTKDFEGGGGGGGERDVDGVVDAEPIQLGGDNEDAKLTDAMVQHDGPVYMQGQLAALLAGGFVIIAVIGYVALLSWRRFLENRYGNREMLCNEEDGPDPNDLRHFSL